MTTRGEEGAAFSGNVTNALIISFGVLATASSLSGLLFVEYRKRRFIGGRRDGLNRTAINCGKGTRLINSSLTADVLQLEDRLAKEEQRQESEGKLKENEEEEEEEEEEEDITIFTYERLMSPPVGFPAPSSQGRAAVTYASGDALVSIKTLQSVPKSSSADGTTSIDANTDADSARLLHELSLLRRHQHPNLEALLGFCPAASDASLKRASSRFTCPGERCASGSTVHLTARVATAGRNAVAVAKGLDFLHTALKTPFIRRGLCSAAILLDSGDGVGLSDFGIVRGHDIQAPTSR